MTTQQTRPQTALLREVEEPAELDGLLQKLMSMGLVLTEVHQMPRRPAPMSLTSRTQDVVPDEQDV